MLILYGFSKIQQTYVYLKARIPDFPVFHLYLQHCDRTSPLSVQDPKDVICGDAYTV